MIRFFALIILLPIMTAATSSNTQAVKAVLEKMIAGDVLPEEILDRQDDSPEFPNLDEAIASVRGCKVKGLEPVGRGIYGVEWWCKGRKRKEQPSAMLFFVEDGRVTRITTAFVSVQY